MIRDFIAIDFETANREPSSVCSVGVVMVRGGQVVDSFYSLIQPEPNYYNYWCQRVHGLSQQDTDDAPVFSKVWQQLEELLRTNRAVPTACGGCWKASTKLLARVPVMLR
jgi:DNA polymerase-3 subunit epsilon